MARMPQLLQGSLFGLLIFTGLIFSTTTAQSATEKNGTEEKLYWVKLAAKNKFERSAIADLGIAIEVIGDDYVVALASKPELDRAKKAAKVLVDFEYLPEKMDFPTKDANFHNYTELMNALKKLAAENPDIVALESIGKSVEGRDLFNIRISTELDKSGDKPGVVFMGTHHAREHLSTEMPLMLAQHLVTEYKRGNAEIGKLVQGREINIIPMVNPDGVEWDIASGRYREWRKNRQRNADGTYGVDLNRNYGYMWGTGGSSKETTSDIYMGPAPFSEPETQAIKNFIEKHENITIMLSFHTFSQLILYPWGHKYESIEDKKDLKVHEVMATTMSMWNGYKPEQISDLYIASGGTDDWAYGTQRVFSFTIEMDPKGGFGNGGFYPGQDKIPVVFQKNIKPCLYLISYADNPYRVLD